MSLFASPQIRPDAPTGVPAALPLRVLIVETSDADTAELVGELERAGTRVEFQRVDTITSFHSCLESAAWDLVLCNWSLPELSGRDALDLVRRLAIDVPFIVMSGETGEEHAVDAIRAGAHDYVLKGKLGRLHAAIARELGEHETRQARRQEELGRQQSERRMRRMIECARVGVWCVAIEGKTSFMNERMAQILGLGPEEAARATVGDFVHPEDRPGFAEGLAQCQAGSPASYEQRYHRKDGTVGWGMFEAGPLYDEAGVLEGVLTMMTDISARRMALEAQREAELRFRRAFDSRITGVTIIDDESGLISEANDTFLELVGYSRADLGAGALNWIAMTPVEWRARNADATAELHTRGSTRPFEKEYLRKDGTRVPVLVGLALLDEERVLTVVTDLTDLKRVETALVERVRAADLSAEVGMALTGAETLGEMLQRCCDAIVRHLGTALTRVWTLNASTKMLELRASAGMYTDIDGAHARVPVGKLKIGIIAEERRAQQSNDLASDLTADESDWARREGMRAFAGQPLVVGGQIVGVMSTFSREPMTDLAIQTLISIADATALRIRDKLTEDANVSLELQLRQSQKMEAVGRLAGGVAHDFNNLLSVVLSYSEMLIDDLNAGDPIRSDIEEIRRAGVRAADLTRQLLMFSRQQITEPRVLDLNETLSGMDKMLRRVVGEDIELTAVLGASLARVRADPGAIEQVIMNLAINARDAMPTGGKLTLETAEVVLDDEYVRRHLDAQSGPHVMMSVSDTGIGMTAETVARIFEPFFTTKELGKGTGLGLSMVFGIIRQSGGNVWVYSEPGVGSTFKIYLPRVDALADDLRSESGPTNVRGSETILLVEDEDQVRHVARGILKRHGYTVIEARNPGEALLLSEGHDGRIDLLLTDVVMPQMGGPALAKRLAGARPEMKVLCMSGYTDDAAVRHGMVDAAFAYLQKPITVQTLTRKVREVLGAANGFT